MAMNNWQPIETAPTDGKIDICAKMWAPAFDEFVYQRFPDCFWLGPDTMTNRQGQWIGLDKYWRATHWMPRPELPDAASTAPSPAEPKAPSEHQRDHFDAAFGDGK